MTAPASTEPIAAAPADGQTSTADIHITPVRIAAAAAVLGGAIHYAVIPDHRAEWWAAAAFFTVLGAFEFTWAALVWSNARRTTLWIGALVNAAAVALWTASRTTGIPFGPHAGDPEAVGTLDVICVITELITIAFALWAVAVGDRDAVPGTRTKEVIAG